MLSFIFSGMTVSVVGCLLISLAALTTTDLATADHQRWSENLFAIQGQICQKNKSEILPNDVDHRQANHLGIFLIFMGLFLAGFGSTVYFSLSVSYLDDNVSRYCYRQGPK